MNRAELIAELERILGPRGVVTNPDALLTYDADGCVMDTCEPHVVTLPTSAEQVAAIVRLAARAGMPIVRAVLAPGLLVAQRRCRAVLLSLQPAWIRFYRLILRMDVFCVNLG
jgi:FAD/FMN-containing dehydrogenase